MKLSIIMTYFNRRKQLIATLKTIQLTECPHSDFDVTIIDDASDPEQRVDDLVNKFGYKINLMRIEPEEKTWIEPLALINEAVRKSIGKIIIIQNAECCHVGDIISYALNNVDKNEYYAFSCVRGSEEMSSRLQNLEVLGKPMILGVLADVRKIEGRPRWLCSSGRRHNGYPFCASMLRKDYVEIGGLNEEFANGFCSADDEFVRRIRYHKKMVIVDEPFVIHQHHSILHWDGRPDIEELKKRNLMLLKRVGLPRTGY